MLKMAINQIRELHDAQLIGIAYLPEASIRLDFQLVDSSKRSILLKSVEFFFCQGLLEGNITSDVTILDAADVSVDDLEYFVKKEGRGQSAERLGDVLQKKQLKVFLMTPSYGAELGCACTNVQFP